MVIFILTGAGIAGLTFVLFKIFFGNFNSLSYLFTLGVLEPAFVVIATLKIDNQQIYKILSRSLLFVLYPKKYRGNQLGEYYNDFSIQDELIVRKNSISKVFQINPHDISALNTTDRQSFFANLKQTLHVLPSQLQILVKKEVTTKEDFTDHFLHLYQSLPKRNLKKEKMVASYQNELEQFIASENLLTIKQYGVFAIPVDTNNVTEKVKAIGTLDDMYIRVTSSLESCHVTTRQLTNIELEKYMKGLLR